MQLGTNARINKALDRAREKHPNFTKNFDHAMTVLTSEIGEIATARLKETPERVEEEIEDTIAVLIRMLERDYRPLGCGLDAVFKGKESVK